MLPGFASGDLRSGFLLVLFSKDRNFPASSNPSRITPTQKIAEAINRIANAINIDFIPNRDNGTLRINVQVIKDNRIRLKPRNCLFIAL